MSDQKTLKFWKYSGLGNKIILIDLVRQPGEISSNDVARLASDSKVEFDQLITCLLYTSDAADE